MRLNNYQLDIIDSCVDECMNIMTTVNPNGDPVIMDAATINRIANSYIFLYNASMEIATLPKGSTVARRLSSGIH